jgi:hypothetical protein
VRVELAGNVEKRMTESSSLRPLELTVSVDAHMRAWMAGLQYSEIAGPTRLMVDVNDELYHGLEQALLLGES